MPNVVEQRGRPDYGGFLRARGPQSLTLDHRRERATRQMVRSHRVLEARMSCARINEIREAKLTDVAEALKNIRVYEPECQLIHTDIVPEWVAQDFESHARLYPASLSGRRS